MDIQQVVAKLKDLADPKAVEGMARFGITAKCIYGVSIPDLRKMAKEIGKDHDLSLKLWDHESRETRILAAMVGEPNKVTEKQMNMWVIDFDFWEVCDQAIMNLFEKTPYAYPKAFEWCEREEEFVRRAGFVLMARLAVSDKKAGDEQFIPFFPPIKEKSSDERTYVKKAVNWALRQIGKRNPHLNAMAVKLGEEISILDSKSARWIASDALRELKSEAVLDRLKQR
ncbi:MAG: DNA alkylation repair protein [Candidatus Aminicenantes bacterium]|nr:DNA alkylation repair protein [Candidatus Aminicenantes bacterium]